MRVCECCGKYVVLLRRPEWGQKGVPQWIACYWKGWDGNPWYVRGNHFVHPLKKYLRRMRELHPREPQQASDPFFSLD